MRAKLRVDPCMRTDIANLGGNTLNIFTLRHNQTKMRAQSKN